MTILRRQDGSVDFRRDWVSYRTGFGNLEGELFIGLEKLYQMTKDKPHELYIKLVDSMENIDHAHYDNFQIGSERESYELKSLGTFSGTTVDRMTANKGMKFSTYDRDNDLSYYNCALEFNGGWWHRDFEDWSCLTVEYPQWVPFYVLTFSEMLIKPKSI
ncbi:ficolin-3-like [Drosophila biarmipes]|uniref:ficolin-3-like n=1 Tax=Drosophila biarmipes TaxID=125945 RepID=UPI0021CD0492|nr:ficolin-3-like [Drosophila biarmipes]